MPIKKYRPVTKGRRISSVQDFSDITSAKPEKSLTIPRKEYAGRTRGKITVRHRGGGHKQRYRLIDWRRDKFDIPGTIVSIEYDPVRGPRIALVNYSDGEKRYMLAPDGLKVGDTVISSKNKEAEFTPGNCFALERIPLGTLIHAVEMHPGNGAVIGRSAGIGIRLAALEGQYATLKMPSGEMRNVSKKCLACVGVVSNQDWRLVRWGKAGRMRHRGIKPTVRGKVMNPVDHPHGGGEGKHPIGMKYAKTKWGKHALGVRTRRNKLASDKLIIERRKSKKS